MKIVKLLTVRQPWAHAIVFDSKDVENRSQRWRYRGPVLILAGLKMSSAELPAFAKTWTMRFGGVIGAAEIIDCVSEYPSKWFEGPFALVLRDRRAVPFVPWRGSQGLANAPQELLQRIDDNLLREYLSS